MKKSIIQLPEIKLVGLKAETRTNNKVEMGANAQISDERAHDPENTILDIYIGIK